VTTADWEITPRTVTVVNSVVDVWRHRRLVTFVGSRTLQKMYRRTVLGWLWLFINPLFPLTLRAIVFGGLLLRPACHLARLNAWLASREEALHLVQGLVFATLGTMTVTFFGLRYVVVPS